MKRPCFCTHLEDAHAAGARCRYCHCEKFTDATTEHTAGLRDLAVHALLIGKRDLVETRRVSPFFVFRSAEGPPMRFDIPNPQIMNDGRAKDVLFGAIREVVQEQNIQAVVFVTDGWFGKSTEKALSIPREEFEAATRHRGFQPAVDQGLVTRSEALIVTVQTPLRTMMLNQLYERDEHAGTITFREVTVMETGVDDFTGRQKMYGDLRPENLG
jgi:hypothetical protein